MISYDDVVHAHEQSYKVMRTGQWHRWVGLAAMILGLAPPVVLLVVLVMQLFTGRAAERVFDEPADFILFGIAGCLAAGGFVQRRAGAVMHDVAGTRHAARVRHACGIGALGALLASVPALTIIGAMAWSAMTGRFAPIGLCGLICFVPLLLPLALVFHSGWLWLRYPAAVETILEGRTALAPQPRDPVIAPPPPRLPPLDVDLAPEEDDPDAAPG